MSFLDKLEKSKEPEKAKKPKELSFFDKTIDYFKSGKFGEALLFQVHSGGPSGAPSMTPMIGKKVAVEVGTIAAVEAAFVPVVGAAAASQVAPGILTALAGLTQAGVTGSALDATTKLVEEGEFPSKEEMLEHGLTWMAIDALLKTLHVGYNFGAAVRKIAKEENIPATKVLNNLWTATKNYAKDKFGRIIKGPQDVNPEDVEILIDEAKRLESKYEPTEIDITPKQKAVEFEKKPEIEYQPKEIEVPAEKIPEVKNVHEMSFEETENTLKDLQEFERKIIEPKVGTEVYNGLYANRGFEEKLQFWEKYKDLFTEDEINTIEKFPYMEEELRDRQSQFRDIRTSYALGETPKESLNQVVSELRSALINPQSPKNKNFIQDGFNYLINKGHTKKEIAEEVFRE